MAQPRKEHKRGRTAIVVAVMGLAGVATAVVLSDHLKTKQHDCGVFTGTGGDDFRHVVVSPVRGRMNLKAKVRVFRENPGASSYRVQICLDGTDCSPPGMGQLNGDHPDKHVDVQVMHSRVVSRGQTLQLELKVPPGGATNVTGGTKEVKCVVFS